MMPTILQQSFSVPFRYPVVFTENLFAVSQTLFVDTFPEVQLARVFFVLDSGVVAHHPELISQIKSYVATYPSRLALVAEPMVVLGERPAKTTRKPISKWWRQPIPSE